MFREVIASGSQDYLKFENVISGNELECWQGDAFTAPVDGIYVFNLHIAIYNQNRAYRLRAWINGGIGGFYQLQENSDRYYGYCCAGHNHSNIKRIEVWRSFNNNGRVDIQYCLRL